MENLRHLSNLKLREIHEGTEGMTLENEADITEYSQGLQRKNCTDSDALC